MGQKRILVRVKKKKNIVTGGPFRDMGEMVSGFDERNVGGGEGCIFIDIEMEQSMKKDGNMRAANMVISSEKYSGWALWFLYTNGTK